MRSPSGCWTWACPGRNVMVLSGNSLEHAVFELAAMQARMPYVPVTPAYSLLSNDHEKLRAMVALIRPAVVLVQEAARYQKALRAVLTPGVQVVHVSEPVDGLASTPWSDLIATPVGAAVQASVDAITPDTVAKYLFTSGSTGVPKAGAHHPGHVVRHHGHARPHRPAHARHARGRAAGVAALEPRGGAARPSSTACWKRAAPCIWTTVVRCRATSSARCATCAKSRRPASAACRPATPCWWMPWSAMPRHGAQLLPPQLRRLTSSGAKLPDAIYSRVQALARAAPGPPHPVRGRLRIDRNLRRHHCGALAGREGRPGGTAAAAA